MNSSNSFNICPRCGNSNALNAKYCSRCGGQLKVPEEPVVCHKCHTHNSPMANFCRNCGTPLKVGSETKICPRCGKEVNGSQAICECGYSFVTYQQTLPNTDQAVDVRDESPETVLAHEHGKSSKVKTVYSKKGGRGWAIAGIILILLFAYYIIAPFMVPNSDTKLRPEFLVELDKGMIQSSAYGYDNISLLVDMIKEIANGNIGVGEAFKILSPGMIMVLALTVIFVITAFVHLIVCIVRSFTAKRSKRMNIYFLIMAIISTLVVGLIMLFQLVDMSNDFMQKVADVFTMSLDGVDMEMGYALWAIPLYFWFFYLYSLGAKAKKLKEQA